MKKTLSLTLSVVLLLSAAPAIKAETDSGYYKLDIAKELTYSAYGENGEWWQNSDAVVEKKTDENTIVFPEDSGASLTVADGKINITAAAPANSKFITAVYGEGGELETLDIKDGSDNIFVSIDAPDNIEAIKCFKWNNFEEMRPVGNVIVSEQLSEGETYLEIKNNDINSSITADEIAWDLLGLPEGTTITAAEAAEAKEKLSEKRAPGTVNHGLFSNKINVNTQSTQIDFTVRFDDIGGFIELSNSTAYGPYINTDTGNITVDNGYASETLFENADPTHWYKFTVALHDGRDENPVAKASVTVQDLNTGQSNTVGDIILLCRKADWYKVNFFPASAYGKTMSLKSFSVSPYEGITPSATPLPEKTPYPTLKPTPSPTPLPEGETPRPTIVPVKADDAVSNNRYTFNEDFEFYEKSVGEAPVTDKLTLFGASVTTEKDSAGNKYVTVSNSATGQRYYTTADTSTELITTKAVTEFRVKFNGELKGRNDTTCSFDILSSSGDNQKSDDTRLVMPLRLTVDTSGNVRAGDNESFAVVSPDTWYTIKTVTDVENKKSNVEIYDGEQLIGSEQNIDFYSPDADGVKNVRLTIMRDSGTISLDDIYIYELNDETTPVFGDVSGERALLANYYAAYGIAQVQSANSFAPDSSITTEELAQIMSRIMGHSLEFTDTSREEVALRLVDIYKELSGDDEPVTAELNFTDTAQISDTDGVSAAVGLSLTLTNTGAFEPSKPLTRYEALISAAKLLAAVNIGITGKIVPPEPVVIKAPHVIDLLPETGVIRDPMVNLSPDGYYYMCCSTGTSPENAKGEAFPRPAEDLKDENLWHDDTGIRIWRSSDLVDWTPVRSGKTDSKYPFYIWNIYEGGTWEKINGFGVHNINNGEQRFGAVLWAPEIHWVKGTYFLTYCINPGGTSIARSVTGKPEGPYVRQECSQDTPLKNRIDASMFWDDDNTVYYTDGSCAIWKMNDDMTAIELKADGTENYISAQAPGKEGGFLFKHNGIYYATAGEFFDGRYDAVIGMNKTGKCMSKGAYGEVHYLYTCGHNGYFEDKNGDWWATMFGNDNDPLANATNGFNNGFALVPIAFDEYDGHVYVDEERLDAWNNLLIERGFNFQND